METDQRERSLGPVPVTSRGGALSREELRVRIESLNRPLLTEWLDLEAQLQPNGVDLTLREVSTYAGAGTISLNNAQRVLPDLQPLSWNVDEMLQLEPGAYHVLFNEVIHLPNDIMALGRPRSSLCRAGATIHSAVWDAGYRGRSTSLLVVSNHAGIRMQRNARIIQLVLFHLSETTISGYSGAYQGENLT